MRESVGVVVEVVVDDLRIGEYGVGEMREQSTATEEVDESVAVGELVA